MEQPGASTKAVVVLLTFACTGCGTAPPVRGKAPTGLLPGQAVAIVAGGRREACPAAPADDDPPTPREERKVGTCLAAALQSRAPELRIVAADEFWAALFPGVAFEDLPRQPAVLGARLRDPAVVERSRHFCLRYVLIADMDTAESRPKPDMDTHGGRGGFLVLAQTEWTRRSEFEVTVLDAVSGEAVGWMAADREGKEGWGCGCGVVGDSNCALPCIVPPVPYTTRTESPTCKAVGEALGEHLGKRIR